METFKKTIRILLITLIFPALMWANKPEVHEKKSLSDMKKKGWLRKTLRSMQTHS